jgi:hypothetical protein
MIRPASASPSFRLPTSSTPRPPIELSKTSIASLRRIRPSLFAGMSWQLNWHGRRSMLTRMRRFGGRLRKEIVLVRQSMRRTRRSTLRESELMQLEVGGGGAHGGRCREQNIPMENDRAWRRYKFINIASEKLFVHLPYIVQSGSLCAAKSRTPTLKSHAKRSTCPSVSYYAYN